MAETEGDLDCASRPKFEMLAIKNEIDLPNDTDYYDQSYQANEDKHLQDLAPSKAAPVSFIDRLAAVEDAGSIIDSFALFEILESYANGGDLRAFSCVLCLSEYKFQFNPPVNPSIVEGRCSCGYRIYIREGESWRQCIVQYFNGGSNGAVEVPSPPDITCATCFRKLTTTRFLDKARARVIMSCNCGSRNYDREGPWWIRRGNTKQRKAPQVQCSDCGRRMWVHTWFDDMGTKVKMLCKCGYRNYSKENNIWVRSPRWKRPVPHVVCPDCLKKMYMSQWLNSEGTKVKMKCDCGCKTLVIKNGIWVRSDWSQRLSDIKLEKEPYKVVRKLALSKCTDRPETGANNQQAMESYSDIMDLRNTDASVSSQYSSLLELVREQFTGNVPILDALNHLSGLSSSTWFLDENARCKADKISISARKLSDNLRNCSPTNAKKVRDVILKLAKFLSTPHGLQYYKYQNKNLI